MGIQKAKYREPLGDPDVQVQDGCAKIDFRLTDDPILIIEEA
jgi:hypothetical protein